MLNKEHIALFIGSDITAHLVMNKVVPQMILSGYQPIIFMPEHITPSQGIKKEHANQFELREVAFYERELANNVVYPFLKEFPYRGTDHKNLSPEALGEKYDLKVRSVPNVNDKEFIKSLREEPSIIGGLSIRCFQIFKPEIIDLFKNRGFFLNLHPGVLPKYRGVMSTIRAMAASENEYGWTLHEIDEKIDTGDILWVTARKLEQGKTGLLSQIDIASLGAESIKRALEELDNGNILKGHPQDIKKGKYYTYPNPSELSAWLKKGLSLADGDEIKQVLVDKFSDASTRHGQKLSEEIAYAIETWKSSNKPPEAEASSATHTTVSKRKSANRKPRLSSVALNFGT
jgi:hypothetical protein